MHGHVPGNLPAGIKPALVKDGRWVTQYQEGHGAVSRGPTREPSEAALGAPGPCSPGICCACDLSLFLPLPWDSPNTPSPPAVPSPTRPHASPPQCPLPPGLPSRTSAWAVGLGLPLRLSPGRRAEPWFPVQPLCQPAVGAGSAGAHWVLPPPEERPGAWSALLVSGLQPAPALLFTLGYRWVPIRAASEQSGSGSGGGGGH